jgi:hypothetical protein
MSLAPYDKPEQTVVQKSDLKPIDPTDKPSWWLRFLNDVRTTIGMKPLSLSERWAEAKVRTQEVKVESEEIDKEIKLLKAKQEFEETMAKVRQMDRESAAKAKYIEVHKCPGAGHRR